MVGRCVSERVRIGPRRGRVEPWIGPDGEVIEGLDGPASLDKPKGLTPILSGLLLLELLTLLAAELALLDDSGISVKPNNLGRLPRRRLSWSESAASARDRRGGDLTSGRTCMGIRDADVDGVWRESDTVGRLIGVGDGGVARSGVGG